MKGLLLKDLYTLWSTMKVSFVFLIICACIPGIATCAIPMMVVAMFPITTFIYDEQAKWQRNQAMMPYTKRDIVFSKYIVGIVAIVAMAIIILVAQYIVNPLADAVFDANTVAIILGVAVVCMLVQALLIPLVFRVGAEKARILMILIIAVVTGVWTMISSTVQGFNINNAIVAVAGVAIVGLYCLSIFVSTKVYRVHR